MKIKNGDKITIQNLYEQIDSEIESRIKYFKQTIFKKSMKSGVHISNLNLLADGDSWFDYPLDSGGIIELLQKSEDICTIKPDILNLSHWGDTTMNEVGLKRTNKIIKAIKECKDDVDFDAILFSGGGNDVAGDQFKIWLNKAQNVDNDPEKGLNKRFDCILELIKASYEELIELRNEYLPDKPIFTYAYDFAIPSGKAAPCKIGPWLKPALVYRGWDDIEKGKTIVKNLLIRLADLLKSLASKPENKLIYINTHGTLNESEWANELHPNTDGFIKIAKKFKDALEERFKGHI